MLEGFWGEAEAAKELMTILSMDPYWSNRKRFVGEEQWLLCCSRSCCSWIRKDVLLNGVAGGVHALGSFLLSRVVCTIASDDLKPMMSAFLSRSFGLQNAETLKLLGLEFLVCDFRFRVSLEALKFCTTSVLVVVGWNVPGIGVYRLYFSMNTVNVSTLLPRLLIVKGT